ncbi:DUF2867 domain-containing protein [Gemmatimonas sp.]|uniref:DUF2867 domain-containing protein n=1 Tax=Gemmatimonas sp. TaxID=1962908 RepID=UPI0037C039FF
MDGLGLRGRPEPQGDSAAMYVEAVVDGWRVEAFDPSRRLLLRAEMRLSGDAWLKCRAEPDGAGTRFMQERRVVPPGLFGHLYWFAMVPVYLLLFPALATATGDRAAVRRASDAREGR